MCSDGDTELGFGGFVVEEHEESRRTFEEEFGGDEEKYFEHRSNAFRWTCCGVDAEIGEYGCDHHGNPRAPGPCKCDYCRAGRPLSERVWRNKVGSQAAKGLERTLRRGRSGPSTPAGELNWVMRGIFHDD